MNNISVSELETSKNILLNKKRKLSKQIDDIDTEIIGINLLLEKERIKERYQLEQKRSSER
jgi:hypothetical protein